MSFGRHLRWLVPLVIFVVAVALVIALAVGIPTSTGPRLADKTGNDKTGNNKTSDYNFFFFFGDSYTNTAFDTQGDQPSPSNPLGNHGLSAINEELAGGDNWATFLTFTFNKTATLTYDFAYNCATVDRSIVPTCTSEVRTIVQQVNEFEQVLKTGSRYGNFHVQNTFYAFWIGINDAHITANNEAISNEDLDGIMGKVASRYMKQLDALYNHGVRNFMLLNVPPYDRTPQVLAMPQTAERQRFAIKSLNDHLALSYQSWQLSHPDTRSLFIDTTPIFNEALDDPTKIGEMNSTCDIATSGPDAGCVWFNDFHPGVSMHRWIAQHVVERAKGIWTEFFR